MEEIESFNRLIVNKEIEVVIKNFLINKMLVLGGFVELILVNFFEIYIKNRIIKNMFSLF